MDEQTQASEPKERLLAYAIWVKGEGWLKGKNPRNGVTEPFTTLDQPVAETAARLYGSEARVLPFDGSLIILEDIFLEREKKMAAEPWWAKVRRYLL